MKIFPFILIEDLKKDQLDLPDTYYDEYPNHSVDNDDDDDDEQSWASSKVADRAIDAVRNIYGPNSQLTSDSGDRIVVQSFFSFPWIPTDQIYRTNSVIDQLLFTEFNRAFQNVAAINKGNQRKIQYNSDTMQKVLLTATRIILTIFNKKPLVKYNNYPIFWVNPEMRTHPLSRSFALSHWIKIPGNVENLKSLKSYHEFSKQQLANIEHYIFGFYNTAGILPGEENPENIVAAFEVGTIERIINYYGTGGNSLKRLSALKPTRILGMKSQGKYTGQTELEGLDYKVSGKY